MGTSMSRRNRTKALAEPVLDYLSDTQALTYMPLTSKYYLRSAHSRRDCIQADSPVEAINEASDLRKHPKVELRELEPLASCMPCLANPSGIVRGGQDGAGQNRSAGRSALGWERGSSSRIEVSSAPHTLCAGWRVRLWSPSGPCSGASACFRIRGGSQGVWCTELARRPGGYGFRPGGLGGAAPDGDPGSGSFSGCPARTGWR